jgi:glycogen debranching enzyme
MKTLFHCFFLHAFCVVSLYSQSIDDLGITVTTTDRQFVFTNKEAGTYHGEVNGTNRGGWQGWFINAEKILHEYSITVNDTTLDRTSARSIVHPHRLVRIYSNGIRETVTLLDSIDVLLIEISAPSALLTIIPTDNFRRELPGRANEQRWVRTNDASPIVPTEIIVTWSIQRQSVVYAVAAGRRTEQIRSIARTACIDPGMFTAKRKERMQRLLDLSPVSTGNRELTVALAWAKLQLDALIMNQSTGGARTKGIFAGLPWFNNYWGRDSFISLPGATYVIGNFADARDVLRSYAAFQERDTTNSNFGRIPNLATPQSVIYNTADGAPWFVRSLNEYLRYSGDTAFAREMYPVVARSIEGTIRHHSDPLGFLTHADAESWMDAVGPNGPWSPRGNRANDVQALWAEQLTAGIGFAETYGDSTAAVRWRTVRDALNQNFARYFVDTTNALIYDHLKSDGTPSAELRPNQLFTLDMPLPEAVRTSVVKTVLSGLVFEHGTATLAQNDSNFHPHHEFPPYYVKDAAYHNGTVWTWLNGIAVRSAVRYDLQNIVFPMTMNSVHQILRRGTVGALSELLDAHPRKKSTGDGFDEPRLSGTYSQAWSFAEFIRSIYQEYFGITVDVAQRSIRIAPKLPSTLNSFTVVQRIGNGSAVITCVRTRTGVSVNVVSNGLTEHFTVLYAWNNANGVSVQTSELLQPATMLTIDHTSTELTVTNGKGKKRFDRSVPGHFVKLPDLRSSTAGAALARPELQRTFPVLRGPSHPLLTHAQVKRMNPDAQLLAEASDPSGDDTGISGTYRYPSSQHFQKGILDITGATFRYDSTTVYCRLTFSKLYDPGWHPEYGFQLTLAAVAVNTGNGTQRNVGINSRFVLEPSRAFDRLILVGGGIRVMDANGTILSEYLPKQEDAALPLGSTKNGTIEFAVPLEYLGTPHPGWKFSILIGAQDDHGGAGIGEFRQVQQEVSEWLGGGNNIPNDSNVYDVMMIH